MPGAETFDNIEGGWAPGAETFDNVEGGWAPGAETFAKLKEGERQELRVSYVALVCSSIVAHLALVRWSMVFAVGRRALFLLSQDHRCVSSSTGVLVPMLAHISLNFST